MMTKQAELKKQAYASTLKSRALSVLIYLIDRSNKELTCFPAIPTMAEQLHISVSTVKRALHELLDAGYIKKDARFREKNKGQTSNLYTLVLVESQPTLDDAQIHDCDSDNHAEFEPSTEVLQEKDKPEQEICHVKHISFASLRNQKEEIMITPEEEIQSKKEIVVWYQEYEEVFLDNKVCINRNSSQVERGDDKKDLRWVLYYLWTGEGVNLRPP